VAAVKKHYKDLQVLEIVLTVAGNNAMTRWTDALGIPQEGHRKFLTETSEKNRDKVSKIAPLAVVNGKPTPKLAPQSRPALPTKAQAEEQLAAARKRTPRLPLVADAEARKLLPDDWPKGALPQWVRLLANFPKAGVGRARMILAGEDKGVLDKKLRAQVHWIAARHDRAWYALGHAKARLKALGVKEDDVWALDAPDRRFSEAQKAAFAFAKKLTVTPARITDDDVAGLRKHYKDREVAELIYQVTAAALFNRLTEAAGLRLEG
jgi:alkylhydroperoxidase family enzyme